MASLNSVHLIGNLGRAPVYRSTPKGRAFTTVSLATTRTWRDNDSNELRSETDWHRIVFEGKAAETARDYLVKGRSIFVEGRLHTRKYRDKNGNEAFITEIVSSHLQMLDKPANGVGDSSEMPEEHRRWLEDHGAAATGPAETRSQAGEV